MSHLTLPVDAANGDQAVLAWIGVAFFVLLLVAVGLELLRRRTVWQDHLAHEWEIAKESAEEKGLDPDDWDAPVEGIWWGSNGGQVVLGSEPDDGYQLYVSDFEGNRLHLYDNWNIWCPVLETVCYFHDVEPGNEIDLSTLEVIAD